MQVTIIGGGSYQWAPKLITDLLGTASLGGLHLVLEDIDPAPLAKMEALAHLADDKLGSKASISTTTDQRRALEGADFVVVDHLHRWVHVHGGRHRRARPPRHPPVGGRQRRARRHQPRPAQHPGPGRHRARHAGAVPRRVAAQHHQPHDDAHPHGVPGDVGQDGRSMPRGWRLLHGSGHRLPPAAHRRAPRHHRRQPLPRHHRARRRRPGRLRHAGRHGGGARRARRHRPRRRRPRGRAVLAARLRPTPFPQAVAPRPLGRPARARTTVISPSSCRRC